MIYFVGRDLFPQFLLATMEECIDYLEEQTEIGLDIETTRKFRRNLYREDVYKPGLDPKVSNILMVQIGTLERKYVIDARHCNIKKLKRILENPQIQKVGHNLQFEGKHFLEIGIRLVNVWDTMIIEKVLYNGLNISYALAELEKRYFGAQKVEELTLFNMPTKKIGQNYRRAKDIYFYKGMHKSDSEIYEEVQAEFFESLIDKSTRLQFINWGDKPFTTKQIRYGARDIEAPLKIKKEQEKGRLVQGKLYLPKKGFILENLMTQVLAESSWRGVKVDPVKWKELYEANYKIYIERKEFLDNYVEENHLEFCGSMDLFSLKPKCAIDWQSSKQVVSYFKWLGFCPKEKSISTGKVTETVGAKALFKLLLGSYKGKFFKQRFPEKIEDNQDLILAYLLFKKAQQSITTFGLEWLKYIHPISGLIHTNYNQYMISSRLSSVGPNLQQIPGTHSFRGCFVGRFLNCDFSGQELRIAAEVHDVEKMIKFFVEGDPIFKNDFHSFSATQVQRVLRGDDTYIVPPKEIDGEDNPEFTKDHAKERNESKNVTFKLNYGGSAFTLAQEFGISIEEAELYIDNFFKGLPGLRESHEKKKREARQRKWILIDSWSGKRYFYPDGDLIQETIQQAESLKPPGYERMSYEQKEAVKQHLRETTDWSKLWRKVGALTGKLERRGLNIPIQGNAATMTKIAAIKIYNWRWKNGVQDEFWIPLYVHDEIVGVTTNYDREKEYANIISKSMIEAGKVTCPRVPQGATPMISWNWEH